MKMRIEKSSPEKSYVFEETLFLGHFKLREGYQRIQRKKLVPLALTRATGMLWGSKFGGSTPQKNIH